MLVSVNEEAMLGLCEVLLSSAKFELCGVCETTTDLGTTGESTGVLSMSLQAGEVYKIKTSARFYQIIRATCIKSSVSPKGEYFTVAAEAAIFLESNLFHPDTGIPLTL